MRIKDIVFLSMLSALAFISTAIIEIPIIPSAPFLKLEIKDAILVTGGFMYGPLHAFVASVIVSALQIMLLSGNGFIAFIMTLLSTASFVCTASVIYILKRDRAGIIAGLFAGCVMTTVIMMLWNYIVTPLFMGIPHSVIAPMIIPVFMPFNLIKAGLNAIIAIIYIKPLLSLAGQFDFYDENIIENSNRTKLAAKFILTAALIIAGGVVIMLVIQKFL